MDLRLFSVDQVPRALPIWELIVADLGRPSAPRIGRALGVSESTVYRWNATGHAPRVAALALFWMTRWGHSQIHAQATNDALIAVQLARSLHEERAALRTHLSVLTDDRDRLRSMVNRLLAQPGRGTASSAAPSRKGTSRADSLGLQWPPLASTDPSFAETFDAAAAEAEEAGRLPAARTARVGRGSPEAPPPGAHSGTRPAPARKPRRGPSEPPAALQSSPSPFPPVVSK
jgi:predicted DNA-binding transcriptional regulator AlpA